MHPVLHGLWFCHPLKGEHDAVPSERDEPVLDDAFHGESRGGLPERGGPLKVATVESELDPHTLILTPESVAASPSGDVWIADVSRGHALPAIEPPTNDRRWSTSAFRLSIARSSTRFLPRIGRIGNAIFTVAGPLSPVSVRVEVTTSIEHVSEGELDRTAVDHRTRPWGGGVDERYAHQDFAILYNVGTQDGVVCAIFVDVAGSDIPAVDAHTRIMVRPFSDGTTASQIRPQPGRVVDLLTLATSCRGVLVRRELLLVNCHHMLLVVRRSPVPLLSWGAVSRGAVARLSGSAV